MGVCIAGFISGFTMGLQTGLTIGSSGDGFNATSGDGFNATTGDGFNKGTSRNTLGIAMRVFRLAPVRGGGVPSTYETGARMGASPPVP